MSDAHVRASYLLQHTLPLLLFRRTQTQTHKQNIPPLLQLWRANTNRDKEIHEGKENVKLLDLPSLLGGFKGAMSKAGE